MAISVLNTDAGLSGKTIVNLEDAQTVTGLKTFDRDPNPPFAVSAGSAVVANLDADKVDGVDVVTLAANRIPYAASATSLTNSPNLTFNGTVFTVASAGTHIIGASTGDSRIAVPSNTVFQFAARNAVGNAYHLGATAGAAPDAVFSNNAGIERMRLSDAGLLALNDTSNANMTTGLTINQGAADDEILALKSSDVAHGITDIAETDTFGKVTKHIATEGGVRLIGLTSGSRGMVLRGIVTTEDATRAISSVAAIQFSAQLKSLTGVTAMTADRNIASFDNNGTTRFILDADGDSHQDVGTAWTNFDDGDDIARLDAVAVTLARENDPLREQFLQHFEEKRAVIEAMPGKPIIAYNDDGHHFVNMSRLSMLHNGAIRQLARENQALKNEIAEFKAFKAQVERRLLN